MLKTEFFFEADQSTQFPPPLPSRNSSTFNSLFSPFSKKLLDLYPTICKHAILSNTNAFFFFSHSRSIMKFLYQLPSRVYVMLILFFTSEEKNLYINSQFYHSFGIYFEPIWKIRLFSEHFNFISYFDILQPEILIHFYTKLKKFFYSQKWDKKFLFIGLKKICSCIDSSSKSSNSTAGIVNFWRCVFSLNTL